MQTETKRHFPAGTDQDEANVIAFYRAAATMMHHLWARWQDEKEYEDIEDYKIPLQEFATQCNVTIGRITKRPFGVYIRSGALEVHCKETNGYYKLTHTRKGKVKR
jgi:uncharacterized protein (DUF849 family)